MNAKVTKFTTDFNLHYLFFEENRATLFDLDGNCISQFECRDKMQEGVFADNRVIVATDVRTLCFYNLRERTNKIVKRKNLIHALFPGYDSSSFYLGTRRIRSLDLELISTRKENTVLKLKGLSSTFLAIKRLYIEEAEPVEISITHAGVKTYICNKTQSVKVFSGAKAAGVLKNFPLPIYKAVEPPFDIPYFAGAQGKIVRVFDEHKKEIFTRELPFAVKDILGSANHILVTCEYGAIFMLNFRGNIVDGGFLAKEIIDCKVSPDGLLWCLTEDGSLMIIAQEETQGAAKINQWLHLDTAGKKTPLQEALSGIKEKDKEHNSKESELQSKAHKLNKKEKELKNLERRLKQESTRLKPVLNEVKERERKAAEKLDSANRLEAEMLRLSTVEELCKKLKELKKKADEEKVEFPVTEEGINKAEQEIKETEKLNSGLNERLKSKKEELLGLKNKASSLSQEELKLNEGIGQAKKELTRVESGIQKKKAFLKSAPQQIKTLEDEESACGLKVKELNDNLAATQKKSEDAALTKENLTEELKSKQEELNLILESTKVVKEKAKNIPEINELAQRLAKLIEETQMEESNV
jgi:hypothetical protein